MAEKNEVTINWVRLGNIVIGFLSKAAGISAFVSCIVKIVWLFCDSVWKFLCQNDSILTDSKMESNFQITGIGEVLWDVFPDRKRFGGAPANFACQAQALGTNTHMVSCVGRDQLGLSYHF